MTTYIPALTLPERLFASPAASILTPIVLGSAVGIGVSNKDTKTTYMRLRQPPLSPPTWVFGPVWTVLYGVMGYASYRAFSNGTSPFSTPNVIATTRHASTVYSVQLALNLIWTPLFFGIKQPVAATVDIVALLGTNLYLTYLWSTVDQVSAYCMVPYLGWLGFATYLCAGIGYVNNWDLKAKEPKTE
ncbi:translocator protein [Diaporthe amygdali]|uniref:translocator protein n=1 Tax=Phomopsis amygdali TaxID=1214568 RepID=UPI0022FDCE61|nr:translocator protein [Diaporthe amygdali]KAJ0118385.1 translocator protein [Diaporthe amygdali]